MGTEQEVRGEFCLIIEKGEPVRREEEHWWEELSVKEHVDHYIQEKEMTSKEAIKQTAKDRDMNKRDVYHVIPCE